MNIEGQDSIFGQENSVATAQSSAQSQLPEPENKMDDSIDNQQQVFGITAAWTVELRLIILATLIVKNLLTSQGHGSRWGPRGNGGGDLWSRGEDFKHTFSDTLKVTFQVSQFFIPPAVLVLFLLVQRLEQGSATCGSWVVCGPFGETKHLTRHISWIEISVIEKLAKNV